MKTKFHCFLTTLTLLAGLPQAMAQGTAFTYQGRLNDGTNPANGNYDFQFYLRDAASGGNPVGTTNTPAAVGVTNGLFIVTLDFGNQFPGVDRWLEIGVRTNGVASFLTLSPRQKLTPTPYAIFANTASNVSGTISTANLSGTYGNPVTFNNAGNSFTGNGSGLAGVNAASLNGLGAGSFWQTTGNAGTTPGLNFVGTTDNQPLELHVKGLRGLRLEPTTDTGFANNAINVIAGSPANFAAGGILGVTIAGGGAPYYFGSGTANRAFDNFTTIGGGVNNDIETNSYESTVGGGNANSIQPGAYRSTISGGWNNTVGTNAYQSVIAGGINNTIKTNAGNSTIAGGYQNTINPNAQYATISGGYDNIAGGSFGYSTVGGGYQNTASGTYSTAGGGNGNSASGNYSTVSGGYLNSANGTGATVAGGIGNSAGTQSFAAGASAHANSNDSFVWGDGSATYSDNGPNTFSVLATNGIYLQGISGKSVSGTPAPVYVNSSGQLGTVVPNIFVQQANAGNLVTFISVGSGVQINNALCNGNPNAILIVTPNSAGGNYVPDGHPFFVEYFNSYWYIVSNGGTIVAGQEFNVMVANP